MTIESACTPAAASNLPWPRERFGPDGRFETLKPIGAGGSGRVFKIVDHVLGRHIAGKFLYPVEGRSSEREAAAEAKAMARLNHENIVRIYDVGSLRGIPYILMEYLTGRPLNEVIAKPGVCALRATEITIDIARALENAHRAHVLHLDVKPSNIFLERSGRAKLLDFGVGSLIPSGSRLSEAEHDETPIVGTPLYMAPEQWAMRQLDARTDIWALGMVFYELLSGAPSDTDHAPSFRLLVGRKGQIPALSRRLRLPQAVDTILTRSLTPDPEDRFQTATALVAALEALHRVLEATAVGSTGATRESTRATPMLPALTQTVEPQLAALRPGPHSA